MKPITISLQDDIKTQTISALNGRLNSQTQYTQNAVAEVTRLRGIIAKCDKCRIEANNRIT